MPAGICLVEKPSPGSFIFAGIIFVLAFFAVSYYEGMAGQSLLNFLPFCIFILVLGTTVAIGGTAGISPVYALPILVLAVKSLAAVPVTIFCAGGLLFASWANRNLIKPSMGSAAKSVFSVPYSLMILIICVMLFPRVNFQIPRAVEGMAVEMMGNAVIGKMIGCDLSMTGSQCLDSLFNSMVEQRCGEDSACRELMTRAGNEVQTSAIEEQLKEVMPTFDRDLTIKENTVNWLDSEINKMVEPYGRQLKFVMVLFIFLSMQFLVNLFVPLSVVLGGLLLRLFKLMGLVGEETVKVDKTVYKI